MSSGAERQRKYIKKLKDEGLYNQSLAQEKRLKIKKSISMSSLLGIKDINRNIGEKQRERRQKLKAAKELQKKDEQAASKKASAGKTKKEEQKNARSRNSPQQS